MKFAAVLRNSAEDFPDAAELFTLYKHLKKSLKRIPCSDAGQDDTSMADDLSSEIGEVPSGEEDELAVPDHACASGPADPTAVPSSEQPGEPARGVVDAGTLPARLDEGERAFIAELTRDVAQLNEQYIEREEANVITFGALKDQAAAARTPEELHRAYKAVVDFHGELLLVLHWSVLAYTGLVKILKKHHKRTGLLLRAPHLTNMLGQPFCSVEVTVSMVGSAEELATRLARSLGAGEQAAPRPAEAEVRDSTLSATSAAGLAGETDEPENGTPREPQGAAELEVDDSAGTIAAAADLARAESGAESGAAPSDNTGLARSRKRVFADVEASGGGGAAAPCSSDVAAATTAPAPTRPQLVPASSVLRRTQAALGLWRQLQLTASSPSTVLSWENLPSDFRAGSVAILPAGSVAILPAGSGLTNGSTA